MMVEKVKSGFGRRAVEIKHTGIHQSWNGKLPIQFLLKYAAAGGRQKTMKNCSGLWNQRH